MDQSRRPLSSLSELPELHIGSLLIRAIDSPENTPQMWLYNPLITPVAGTIETIDTLIKRGWQQVPSFYQFALCTQLHDAILLQDITDEKRFHVWTPETSANYVKQYPVALAGILDIDEESNVQTISGRKTIFMLTPLPLPNAAMNGFILNGFILNEDQTSTLDGYPMNALPDEAKRRALMVRQLLVKLAGARWIARRSSHDFALDLVECQREINKLITRQHITYGETRHQITLQIAELRQALLEVRQVLKMQMEPTYAENMKEVRQLMQQLARDYFELHLQQIALNHRELKQLSLPKLTTSHQTMLPSIEHFRGLSQSFGPRVTRSLWNTETTPEQLLEAPNGAQLAVRGENGHEQVALHQFIEGGMGVEGIKYMIALMAIYFEQTGAVDRKTDARVTLRQMLQFMGRGDHADDLDEQRKVMHYILYLARTWITALDKAPETAKRRGRPRRAYFEYTPLIVLEALGSDARGGIRIPDAVEFHLGKEYWDQMFGNVKHFFTLPTALILGYDSKRQSHEICLAFYLANMINLNFGEFDIHFPVLLIQTGLQDQQDIDSGHDRTRNALRVVYALEQLEKDAVVIREAHEDIDTALAADFLLGSEGNRHLIKLRWEDLGKEQVSIKLSEHTFKRLQQRYRHFQLLPDSELLPRRREALQSLLERVKNNTIKFTSGSLINQQISKRVQGRQDAIEKREQAQEAGRKPTRKKKTT